MTAYTKRDTASGRFFTSACWCGTRNPYFAPLGGECAGTGTLHCICGGDFCICHWHGETDCPGCEDCEPDEEWDDLDESA